MNALQEIEKVEKFIRNNLSKVKEWKIFVTAVQDELTKAAKTNATIQQLKNDFESHLNGDVIKNFDVLQQTAQKPKTNTIICSLRQCKIVQLNTTKLNPYQTL